MDQLSLWQLILVFIIFIWSGFVRTALGFGGAALALPLFLLIIDNPVEILPIIGVHLLFSVAVNLRRHYHDIDWQYLGKVLPVIILFTIVGVIGLLNLPANVLNIGVYIIVILYALSYITQIRLQLTGKTVDWLLLSIGGYISGTSLIGAPLIIIVFGRYLPANKLRSTLFALWFILVSIKLAAFVISDTSLNFVWALYTLPASFIGYFIGDKVHQKILTMDKRLFMRFLGSGLLLICIAGLARMLFMK